MAKVDSILITLAPQFELTITHNMGGVAAGFTIIAGISRSTGGGAGNEFTNELKVKLEGIETAAKDDLTGAEIKVLYELEDDTNAFNDAAQTKLAGIENAATADQTNAEIRTAVEAATDSNVFTDTDHSKLNAIEANATADQTNSQIKTAYEANANTNVHTDAQVTKLAGIDTGAKDDQTAAEIRTLVGAATDSNVFQDADASKLDGIETGATADQTDGEIETAYNAQVAKISAGEITAGTEVTVRRVSPADLKAIVLAHETGGSGGPDADHYADPLSNIAALVALTEASLTDKQRRFVESEITDYFYDEQASAGDEAPTDQTGGTGFWLKVVASGETPASIKTKYESNDNTNVHTDAQVTKLGTIEDSATADQTNAEIRTAVAAATNSNVYDDTAVSKLAAIEASATADQTDAEIRTAVEAATDSNVFTDADHTKLNNLTDTLPAVNEHVVDYTLALTDANDIQEMNKATAIILTIPTFAAVAYPVGTVITVSMTGVGVATILADTGVTLNGVVAGSGDMDGQWAGVSLYNRAEDVWVIQGAIGVIA